MYDPPRAEAKTAVAKCLAAGIRVVMITGDHPHTATAIARELGIFSDNDKAITAVELEKLRDDELRRRSPNIAVYARVTAEYKLRIVRAWKANNAVLAMTGDGVNDAPAIKGADSLPALCLATDPIDPEVIKHHPRQRAAHTADAGFLGTMLLTGVLTAGVSFAVYLYGLRMETTELARTYAFAVLVFAELLRSFGCRSETKGVWRIPLLTNLNLVFVVAVSFGLQLWSHHSDTLAGFLKTSILSYSVCWMLLAVSFIPLAVLEGLKYVRLTLDKPRARA